MEKGFLFMGKWYPYRQPRRKKNHDYASTASYLITICTRRKEPFFEISALYHIIEQTWYSLPERFPHITLDAFIIMPDHLHFILHLQENEQRIPLGRIIQAFKSLVCHHWLKTIEAMGPAGIPYTTIIWHRDFDDVILSTPQAIQNARQYVRNNPFKTQ